MVYERRCTDALCACIFILSFIASIFIFIYGYRNGDLFRLTSPINSDLKFCGISPGYEDYRYLLVQPDQDLSNVDVFNTNDMGWLYYNDFW